MDVRRFFAARRWLASAVAFILACCALGAAQAQQARTLDTAFGAVTVKGRPERIVALSENGLDTALAAGTRPLGTLATRGGEGVSAYLAHRAGDIAIVGTARETNLEAVLKLRPDVILAPSGTTQNVYAKLSALAPTIVPKGDALRPWRDSVLLYADALGRRAEIDAALKEVDARTAAIEARLPAGERVSVVRWNPQGPVVMSSRLFAGQLLGQAGLAATPLADSLTAKPHSDTLSMENLVRIDADWLLVATLNAQGGRTLEQARSQPAFRRLQAVQAGHVAAVDGQVWTSGSGVLAAHIVLDDIERTLLGR
ncbi:putative siderophore-binding lipoprotein YfiY precursor [Pigmentiphaga humi]|uniref:Putative siderophore-binding lipoprotein YfiY n=1 Tax=Pigmentiphaga humi TaxID=2478468 RepID=A0A3P4BAA8_9BURK|nr:iron-siderophore ABC transporter substrate-binding protein [Pigmentiphaga humi]VCU72466.1 putative siderophore-binding lipoprotein YfiY precursor [Pigmentiphaga humi]